MPAPDKSWQWNSGYSQGFIGTPALGNHTEEFWNGYRNGTSGFQWITGVADGWANRTMSEKTLDYVQGYENGQSASDPKAFTYIPSNLPANTTDHYMHYCIGFSDGQLGRSSGNVDRCPYWYTHEYCVGNKLGDDYEHDALDN